MEQTDELLKNNGEYSKNFEGRDLMASPVRKLAVVACMDARLDIYRILGIKPGEAHVIRNAGGVVTDDVIRSLIISQRLMGTEEIVLVHHTDCGMLKLDENKLKEEIEKETAIRPPFAFEAFRSIEGDIRQNIARLRASPFIAKGSRITGMVYDVRTGRLSKL
ncbi:MAG: carbonic anhydrase [Methanomassiliicoccales archaeon]